MPPPPVGLPFGTTRSNSPFRRRSIAPVTFGTRYYKADRRDEYVPHLTQSKEEKNRNRDERREEKTGRKWTILDARVKDDNNNSFLIQRSESDNNIRIAIDNANTNTKLIGNKLTVCDRMGQCAIYVLTAASVALVAAKLAGTFGGKKSRRTLRNKSKRKNSKHNKSKKFVR
jgi:hypothetical protein